jgi:SAM-dependent methyltransferase
MADNAEQREYWNAKAGETWARFHEQLDRQIAVIGQAAIDALAPQPGERVLDIGCGCGQTTLDIAACVAPNGSVLGADISRPMLEIARTRPRARELPVQFRELDVQTDDLRHAAGAAPFDAAYSRFGVMFFSDPVSAFTNIRKSLRPRGRLVFACWRTLLENDWMRKPLEAALPMLPPMPPADPAAPGPFAFADAAKVDGLLRAAGFATVTHRPFDALVGSGDLEQTSNLLFRVGPLGAALRDHPEYKERVAAAVRSALEPYITPQGVLMPAATWIFEAASSLSTDQR